MTKEALTALSLTLPSPPSLPPQVGSDCLLMDEDTCATNFMIRDFRMQLLVSKDKEPITPFLAKARSTTSSFLASLSPTPPGLIDLCRCISSCHHLVAYFFHYDPLSFPPSLPSLPPSLPQIQALYNQHGVSSLLVIGGAGDYFGVATTLIPPPLLPSLPPLGPSPVQPARRLLSAGHRRGGRLLRRGHHRHHDGQLRAPR